MIEKQATILAHLATERAIDELRRQMGLVIETEEHERWAAFPVEFLTPALLEHFYSISNDCYLLLTASRAKTLGIETQEPALFALHEKPLEQWMSLADPTFGEASAIFQPVAGQPVHHTLLQLSKYASLLPALLVMPWHAELPQLYFSQTVQARDVQTYMAHPALEVMQTAAAALPIHQSAQTRIIGFRSLHSVAVHLALLIGEPQAVPLTRIHSSCITGDILGSLRCDCGDQLQLAMDQIGAAGGGIVLYLHQEGRGIGITNKLRAYRLQEQGIDTYEANLMLGFSEDERDFGIAAAMLKTLGYPKIRLLTNNPHKLEGLQKYKIDISERVPLITEGSPHNAPYLAAKSHKFGHLF